MDRLPWLPSDDERGRVDRRRDVFMREELYLARCARAMYEHPGLRTADQNAPKD
jgi:hypothetical protein